jgi:K+-sensing histidine kinase KdpD
LGLKGRAKINDGTVQFNRDKTEQQGLGLGLYITKHIIKKSDGIITILSEEKAPKFLFSSLFIRT